MEEWLGLAGRNAFVMGGGAGIGEQTVLCLARAGCNVVVGDMVADSAEAVAEAARGFSVKAATVAGDVMIPADVTRMVAEAEKAIGGIDRFVTIVGVSHWASLLDMSVEMWDLDQDLNLRHVFLLAREVARTMLAARRPGAITCVTSISGVQAAPNHAAYGAAKAGLIHLVRSMAVEWAPHGIRVNAVGPGSIITPRMPATRERDDFLKSNGVPLGRRGEALEIAKAILFLSSDMASYVTGQNLMVDGGWSSANLCVRPSTARA